MKSKTLILAGAIALAAAQLTGTAFAKNVEKIQSFKKILAKVAVAERPAKVASLIAVALPADKKETMESLVEAVAQLNPTALPAVIGAIAKQTPELAVAATELATTLVPEQTVALNTAVKASASKTPEVITPQAITPRFGTPYANPNPNPTTTESESSTKNTLPGPLVGSNYSAP